MLVLGLLGGIASGKSLVASEFVRLGAGLLDADRVGHEVLNLPHVMDAIRERWGSGVFGGDGAIDRARLAEFVFGDLPEVLAQRKYLEQLTHPEIARLLNRQARTFEQKTAAEKKNAVVVLDAPLLMESGWISMCDRLAFVEASREVREARALTRGWSREDFVAREAAQESLDCKRAIADVIIDNSGSLEDTRAQIERYWPSLVT